MENTAIATDIYERLEMNESKQGGSVWSDISEMMFNGDSDGVEDYFGDLDPTEFL